MYETLQAIFHTRDPGTVLSSAIAFLFFAALIWHLTGVLGSAKEQPAAKSSNRLVAMLGALCGWIIGIAFSPFTKDEADQFTAISSVISAFLSGYVVSKVDRFVEGTLFPVSAESRDSWARVGLFASALLLASVTVFVNRLYAFRDSGGRTEGIAQVSPAASAASAVAAAVSAARVASDPMTLRAGSAPIPNSESPPAQKSAPGAKQKP
jgi:hypothetical protein